MKTDTNQNYFAVGNSMSWKDIADQMEKPLDDHQAIFDDGLAEMSRQLDHGQLAIDIYQTASDLIVEAPISGVKSEDLDISIVNDVLTIKGKRERSKKIKQENLLYQEVHWGSFSRSIVLPFEVINDRIDASLKDGILTIRLPKANKSRSITVKVK